MREYSFRHTVAIERPEVRDPVNWFASSEVHKRKTRLVERDGVKLQLVSILTVDLDTPPVWHARVGYLQAAGADADYFLPLSTWTPELEQEARAELRELTALPREVERCVFGQRPKGRASTLHCFIPLSRLEQDWLTAIQCGGASPIVRIKDPRRYDV